MPMIKGKPQHQIAVRKRTTEEITHQNRGDGIALFTVKEIRTNES